MTTITESVVEEAALDWLTGLGWQVGRRANVAPDSLGAERSDYGQVVLERRLRDALALLNPVLPASALDDAYRKLTRPEGSTLEASNRAFHRMLVNGVTVEHRDGAGRIRGAQVQVIDFDDPPNNDFLAVNQFTVSENRNTRRPDIVLFVNGLPLSVIELKNPADEDATIWTAWQQLQTYKAELPVLFFMNEALVVSDGTEARVGTLTSGKEWFKPWRTVTGETLADPHMTELQVMLEGIFDPARFLALIRDFVVFEDDGSGALFKKMAGYHQFHAVRVAVGETLRAAQLQREERRIAEERGRHESGRRPGGEPGDRRIGVVWHTQGSGKSLTMAFYSGAIIRESAMENPTVVVLTDRNDLDDQLFGTFSRSSRRPIVSYYDFTYQAQSWSISRRVVAKVEWHQGELFPRVGFIVTNLSYPPKGIVRFYNGRGTAEQWIKEGKYALSWTRLSCHKFVANQVRLWLFVLTYNLGNFMRRLVFQLAEVLVTREMLTGILERISRLRLAPG